MQIHTVIFHYKNRYPIIYNHIRLHIMINKQKTIIHGNKQYRDNLKDDYFNFFFSTSIILLKILF